MKLIKRSISLALAAAFLITGMLGAVPAQETQAAPRLSKSSVTLTIGKSTTLRDERKQPKKSCGVPPKNLLLR